MMTWEEAVDWLRGQPDQQALVRDCYYDDPLIDAATRFVDSGEWRAVRELLPKRQGRALDLGAGRGISSYALAFDGWRVTALEPDPSPVVGSGAIRSLVKETGLSITIDERWGERLPYPDASFELVHGRQVLHHARDLNVFCSEVGRVLKRGGTFIATREHVISRSEDLGVFLERHPLHRFYGGENAYLIRQYISAIIGGGLSLLAVLGPYDSPINYFPMTDDQWRQECLRPLSRMVGVRIARLMTTERFAIGRRLLKALAAQRSRGCETPGRLYSFVAVKP
ncbi:MAG TPA: class I SAM-dependent methyltransferase [Nitrospiria bacterium]|nr:class I SAM-dependent methyltransferase [Nitrospiria bacterium]